MSHLDEARALLNECTPLKTDCGSLCGQACCQPDPDAGGEVWLLPGEEACPCEWARMKDVVMPVSGMRAVSVCCDGLCDRARRPFMCRVFPLVPYYSRKKGAWDVRMDRRAWMVCPLASCGVKGLDPEFTDRARKAVALLAQDPECEAFLRAVSQEESAYRVKL